DDFVEADQKPDTAEVANAREVEAPGTLPHAEPLGPPALQPAGDLHGGDGRHEMVDRARVDLQLLEHPAQRRRGERHAPAKHVEIAILSEISRARARGTRRSPPPPALPARGRPWLPPSARPRHRPPRASQPGRRVGPPRPAARSAARGRTDGGEQGSAGRAARTRENGQAQGKNGTQPEGTRGDRRPAAPYEPGPRVEPRGCSGGPSPARRW